MDRALNDIDELNRSERRVMLILLEHGKAPFSTIHSALPKGTSKQAVQVTLTALLEKGLINRTGKDKSFVYTPRVQKRAAFQASLTSILKAFTNNSAPKILKSLVSFGLVTEADIENFSPDDRTEDPKR